MYTSNFERWVRIIFSILEILLIGAIVGLLLMKATKTYHPAVFTVGMIIWIALCGLTSLLNRFIIYVPENHGLVVVNMLRTYEDPDKRDVTILEPTRALREVSQGYQGIFLWENPKAFEPINLGRKVNLKDEIVEAVSADKVKITLKYTTTLTPLSGYLCNLVRIKDLETIKAFFQARFSNRLRELVLQEYVIPPKGEKSILERADHIKKMFNLTLGGKGVIDEDEKQYATFSGDPQIGAILLPQEVLEAIAQGLITEQTAGAIDTLMRNRIGLTTRQAAIIVLAQRGKDVHGLVDINISGLERLTSLDTTGLAAMIATLTSKK